MQKEKGKGSGKGEEGVGGRQYFRKKQGYRNRT